MSTDTTEAACLLRLYIVDGSPPSMHAKNHSQSLVSSARPSVLELEIVDVAEAPDRAELDSIIATPTLMRVHPLPILRVFGDLSDRARVISILGLEPFLED